MKLDCQVKNLSTVIYKCLELEIKNMNMHAMYGKSFKIRNMSEYHDLYLKTDTILLANVFESFRSVCMKNFGLDPAHFYTAPGLAWKACLKKTGIRL